MTDASARSIGRRSLIRLGVVDPRREMSAGEADQMLALLNDLVDTWSLQRRTIFQVLPNQHVLVSGTGVYTIGPGADFDQVRPTWIEAWAVIPDRDASPVIELPPRRPSTLPEWQAITAKGLTGPFPSDLYFDHTFSAAEGWGQVHVYPVPSTSAADVLIYTPTPLAQFATLDTVYRLPAGYRRALVAALALEAADSFGATPSADLKAQAAMALGDVKRANVRPVESVLDPRHTQMGGRYNIYTNEYR